MHLPYFINVNIGNKFYNTDVRLCKFLSRCKGSYFGLVHFLKTIQLIELMVINLLSDYQSWLAATLKISNQKTQFTYFQVIKPHFVGEKTLGVLFNQPVSILWRKPKHNFTMCL